MTTTAHANEIPASTATGAFTGTSHVPEKRGESVRAEYAETFNTWAERMRKRDPQDGTPEELEQVISDTLPRYRRAFTAWLHSRAGCLSPMITGPANFPVRRNEKKFRAADNASDKIRGVLDSAEKHIRRRFFPLDNGISSDRGDAADLLREKLAKLEADQAHMKAANKIIRKHKSPTPEALAALAEIGISEAHAGQLFKPDFCGRVGYPDYALQNNNANIRRVRQRIAEVETRAQDETTERESGGVRIVDDVEANRLRLYFPSKPDAEVRALLKQNGFKWSPKAGAWQRMRGPSAENALDRVGLGPRSGGNHAAC